MTARVFVPLVDARGEAAHLFEAIAGEIPPEEHPARLVPQIAELFDFGLYGVGQSAREAVMSFIEARRRRLWLSPAQRQPEALAPAHFRSAARPSQRRQCALGRPRPDHRRAVPDVRARSRRRVRHRRDPSAERAGRDRGRRRPGLGHARQARADRRLSRPARPGARRPARRRRPAGARRRRPRAGGGRTARCCRGCARRPTSARIKLEIVFADTLEALDAALGPFAIPELVDAAPAPPPPPPSPARWRWRSASGARSPMRRSASPSSRRRPPARAGAGRRRAAAGALRRQDRQARTARPLFRRAARAAGRRRRDAGSESARRGRPAVRQPRAADAAVHRLGFAQRRSRHPRRRAFSFAAARGRDPEPTTSSPPSRSSRSRTKCGCSCWRRAIPDSP